MGYATPADVPISDNWFDHKARDSAEPGTDYGTAYGTSLRAPEAGTVIGVDRDNGGPGGRRLTMLLDDGRMVDWIHLAEIWVNVGDRFSRGQLIALSGASRWGSDWGVGPHVHVTLRADRWRPFADTLNFEDYIGGDPAVLDPNQRRAGANGLRARRAPSTSAEVVDASFLAEGEVGTFAGYVIGENVDGENRWAKGTFSGLFFWLGGLTPQGVDGLPLLDAPAPAMRPDQRQADGDGVKGRADATTSAAQLTFLEPNDVGDFDGWKHGQAVDGEDRWLRGAHSGAWFWLGGLSPRTVDALAEVKGGTTPPVTPPADQRVIYPTPAAPSYPKAAKWAHSSKCDPRKSGAKVRVIAFHWWGDDKPHTAEGEWAYFTGWQVPLGSSPTWQANGDGSIYEVVPPDGYRPWTTGQLDHEAVTIEIDPNFTDEVYEALAQVYAFSHERYGIPLQPAVITGTGKMPVIEQGGMTSHKLTPAGKESGTKCPGELDLDRILRRTKEIVAAQQPKPEPGSGLTPEAAGFWQWLFDAIKGFFKGAK